MARARTGNTLALGSIDKPYAINPNHMNIVRVFQAATVKELDEGLNWYREANALARRLDPNNVRAAAGVIAALSPITPWDRNMALAVRAYEDGQASGSLGANCAKVDAILAGAAPEDVIPPKSKKVRAFFECIAADGMTDAVCVDRHALDIALGRVTNDATRSLLSRVGNYEKVAAAYVRAAKILGYTPAQVQAVTWVAWRRMKGL